MGRARRSRGDGRTGDERGRSFSEARERTKEGCVCRRKRNKVKERCVYISLFWCYPVSPAGADLRGASPAASRRRALLRSAGMLGVNGQVWLIPSRCALGRSYKTSWATAVTTRARSVRDKSEAWMNIASSPALRSNAMCRAAAGMRHISQLPQAIKTIPKKKRIVSPSPLFILFHSRRQTQLLLVLFWAPRKEHPRSSSCIPIYRNTINVQQHP